MCSILHNAKTSRPNIRKSNNYARYMISLTADLSTCTWVMKVMTHAKKRWMRHETVVHVKFNLKQFNV